jgi:deoxyribodipyrimidine photolyase-like uncharacterized protein
MRAALICPHQLFTDHPALRGADICVLVEEPLLLTQYRFHRQKLILHRASMQQYADRLRRQKRQVRYVECRGLDSTGDVAGLLAQLGTTRAQFVDPCDDWLQQVIDAALERADRVPLNSLEGFVRQIVGWREYMRGVYRLYGRRQRTRNFWNHRRPMPAAFYDGTTGIEPADTVIRRVLHHAYCHHIERLMILGNFMLLCEIDPTAIYQWFMELFIDAYDWVMVPNVFGMSQHADGGLITTKPYLSGSSYVLKMSNFRKGPWCTIWDALYWRFVDRHRDFFAANPRMSVMVAQCERMGTRLDEHRRTAAQFLTRLHGGS